jgi:hypothetical protein
MLDIGESGVRFGVASGVYIYTGVGVPLSRRAVGVISAHALMGVTMELIQAFGYSGPIVMPLNQSFSNVYER